MTISDRMVIMDKKGVIRQLGTPEEIWNHPKDRDVYAFLGVSNFLPLLNENGSLHLVSSSGKRKLDSLGADIPEDFGSRLLLASRPTDIRVSPLSDAAAGVEGVVERVTYLGHQFDYFVNVGGHTVRVQEDSLEAFGRGVPAEGSPCAVEFLQPAVYEADPRDPRFDL